MKLQGKVTNWNDDKGFGFVDPNGGGNRAFIHIKAFTSGSLRPVNGDIIIYELVRDQNNRYQADKIKFAGDNKNANKTRQSKSGHFFGTFLTMIFCVALAGAVFTGKLISVVAGIYLLMSFVAFIAYAIDKSAAQKGRWRTKESTLHLYSLLGGWPGAFFAQKILGHKLKKDKFKTLYWVTVMVNISVLFCFLSAKNADFINSIIQNS
ncbi:hypothetical protein DUF1294 [Psychromonas ingrahamii 37]|uniref:CSD domain-containing protein n=1 Tax=Psychromonas ingrahamii (strain DSM 17664 / CCUG 51855 / 37) TaxID=357804 RepID=A1SYJ2_PSYIN|nr:DUF1294 domain-containing protein [Psychromonas ingrahamii]ABM04557.1 hypothetical protein DUF1294 [Psychromonas ingrahamii 37]